jgi:hypothetical protein
MTDFTAGLTSPDPAHLPVVAPFIQERLRNDIIEALRGGVTPTAGIPYVWVNRNQELLAVEKHLDHVAAGAAGIWFFVGRVGTGKTALQALTRISALQKDFAVMRADLTMGRRLSGPESLDLYRHLVSSLTLDRGDSSTDPLEQILVLAGAPSEMALADRERTLSAYLGATPLTADFARVVVSWLDPSADAATRADALRWIRGDIRQRDAGGTLKVRSVINEKNYYDALKLLAKLARYAGLSGLLVAVDEVSQLASLPQAPTRAKNYGQVLHMINDIQQCGAPGLAIFLSGTEECLDPRRGFPSHEALRSRLMPHSYSGEGFSDHDAHVVRLSPIAENHLALLCEKVHDVFTRRLPAASLITTDEIAAFVRAFRRSPVSREISTRDLLRDFVGLLTVLQQKAAVTDA